MLEDCQGKPFYVGQTIVYPVRQGSDMRMHTAIVTAVGVDRLYIFYLSKYSKKPKATILYRYDRAVIVKD